MADKPKRWEDIICAIQSLSALHNDETEEYVEELLIAIMHSQDQLILTSDSELPHSRSPEEMLKSLAVQLLVKLSGEQYLPDIRIMVAAAPALESEVDALINSLRKGVDSRKEAVMVSTHIGVDVASDEGDKTAVLMITPDRTLVIVRNSTTITSIEDIHEEVRSLPDQSPS